MLGTLIPEVSQKAPHTTLGGLSINLGFTEYVGKQTEALQGS